jgi:hypothetical protein
MNSKVIFGTLLATLLLGMMTVVANMQLARANGFFVVEIRPEQPTTRDEVNATTILLYVASLSWGFEFGPLVRDAHEFSVDINISVPYVWSPTGPVNHTYELGKLSEGSYNFSATVYTWKEINYDIWVKASEDLYRESFVVLAPPTPPVGGITVPMNNVQRLSPVASLAVTLVVAASFVGVRRIKKRQD